MGAFENLGQALRWLRSRQHRKQYEIAAVAGITKAMLSAYETGKQNPSIETLEKILEALGTDLSDLHHALVLHRGGAPEARPQPVPWAGADRLGEGPAGRVDVYQTLALGHPLPAEQERAIGQMLEGFHGLLRYTVRQLDPAAVGRPPAGGREGRGGDPADEG